ncbi:MAG: hypothetical protein V7782_00175 [Psychromonas sp.]
MINKHTLIKHPNSNNVKAFAKHAQDIPNINLLLVSRDINQNSQIDKQISREVKKLTRQVINKSNKEYKEKEFQENSIGKMYCKLRDAILKRHSTL